MSLAIELRNISKFYPGTTALSNVCLEVKAGSVHGFIGPNGAGKSTAMKIIAGLIPPSSGQAFVEGFDVATQHEHVCSRLGLLPENPPLYLDMTVSSYLDFCQRINSKLSKKEREAYKDSVLEKCHLKDVSHRLIRNLSRGYKQRVAMAQALSYGAKTIVLDEPTIGLDPNAIADVRNLIEDLKGEHTILLSSHQLQEVARVCDEISIINNGEILRTGPLGDIQNEYNSGQAIEIHGQRNIEATLKGLEQKYSFEILSVEEREGMVVTKILCQGGLDLRPHLIRDLSAQCEILEFRVVRRELEDIFKEVVNRENKGDESYVH